jgi:hypothetical protein
LGDTDANVDASSRTLAVAPSTGDAAAGGVTRSAWGT